MSSPRGQHHKVFWGSGDRRARRIHATPKGRISHPRACIPDPSVRRASGVAASLKGGIARPTRVVSVRLQENQVDRLKRFARRQQRRPSESLSMILEEALRASEFPLVPFRDTVLGREAYVVGTSTAGWEMAWLAQQYEGTRTASHLEWPVITIQATLAYAVRSADEVTDALADMNQSASDLARQLPGLHMFTVDFRDEAP